MRGRTAPGAAAAALYHRPPPVIPTIDLPGTGLTTSRLGFGTASLMGRLGRRESVRLLECAYESSVRHFDTARAYGFGEAESALGEFLARHRDEVTVTTKLGILPPSRSRGLAMAKAMGRAAAARAPVLRPVLRRGAASIVREGRFDPEDARRSLETSLRELRVEAVDILLLHECRPADLDTEGLRDVLDGVLREGKARCFGIGTDPDSTRTIVTERPEFAHVVQLRHNAVDPALDRLPPLARSAVIAHTAMGPTVDRVVGLMADRTRRERWSRELGVDCARRELLGRLVLAHALRSNPGGVVLFCSTSEERIRANAALAASDEPSPEQVDRFAALVREAIAGEARGSRDPDRAPAGRPA
jgi:D-threo-aldose 1-dehydrogenase